MTFESQATDCGRSLAVVSATCRFVINRNPTDCSVSLCVIQKHQERDDSDMRRDVPPEEKRNMAIPLFQVSAAFKSFSFFAKMLCSRGLNYFGVNSDPTY